MRALASLSVASILLVSVPSWGADSADQWVNRGIDRYTHKDYEAAREDFARAYALVADPSTLIDLGLAEVQSGHELDGARHLRAYLQTPGADPVKVRAVRTEWLARTEAKLGRLAVTAPDGSDVAVDGQVHGRTPLTDPVDVSAGDHEVLVRRGAWSEMTHVTAPAGQVTPVHFEVSTPTAPPPSLPASPPPALVPSQAMAPESPPRRGPSRAKLITVIAVGGAAIVTTGLAIGFGVASQSNGDEAATLRAGMSSNHACLPPNPAPACPQLASDVQRENNYHNASVGLYVAGGALAAVGLATWFLWPQPRAQSAWRVQPWVDARQAGALMQASF